MTSLPYLKMGIQLLFFNLFLKRCGERKLQPFSRARGAGDEVHFRCLLTLTFCITSSLVVSSPIGISQLLTAPCCDNLWYKDAHMLKLLKYETLKPWQCHSLALQWEYDYSLSSIVMSSMR